MTCSTSYCLYDILMDPQQACMCVCVCVYIYTYEHMYISAFKGSSSGNITDTF